MGADLQWQSMKKATRQDIMTKAGQSSPSPAGLNQSEGAALET